MSTFRTSLVGRCAAVLGAATMTFAILSGLVSLSEPQRSQLAAATASRQPSDRKSDESMLKSQQPEHLALRCPTPDGPETLSVDQKEFRSPDDHCQ
jgi:hypothetical protein